MANNDYSDWVYGQHDKAFVDWLNTMRHLIKLSDGTWAWRHIPKCFATPDRAHAQIAKVLQKSVHNQTGEWKKVDTKTIPIPFMSISRTTAYFDASRFQYGRQRYVGLQMPDGTLSNDPADMQNWVDGYFDATKIIQTKYPIPVDLKYQVEYWCRNKKHVDVLDPQLWKAMTGGRLIYLTVEFGGLFGNRLVPLFLEAISDNSRLEGGEENREQRRTYEFTFKGWIPNDPILVNLVQRTELQIWTSDDMVHEEELVGVVIDPR